MMLLPLAKYDSLAEIVEITTHEIESHEAAEQRHHASQASWEYALDGVRICEMG